MITAEKAVRFMNSGASSKKKKKKSALFHRASPSSHPESPLATCAALWSVCMETKCGSRVGGLALHPTSHGQGAGARCARSSTGARPVPPAGACCAPGAILQELSPLQLHLLGFLLLLQAGYGRTGSQSPSCCQKGCLFLLPRKRVSLESSSKG